MEVAIVAAVVGVYVFALEVLELDIAARDDEIAYDEYSEGKNYGAMEVWSKHTPIADAAAEDGNDFGVSGHLRGEEERGDEHEQRSVEVEEVGYEIKIILKDNLLDWSLVFEEIVELLGDVEGDDDNDDKYQPKEKSLYVFS